MEHRNITLRLPSDLIRRAKMIAAARDTSITALVREYLSSINGSDDYDEAWEAERRLMEKGLPMRVGEVTWTRTDTHER
ncbi:MAG: hypothetical protein GEU79_12475 [Acidimicrobiia bacterium]|nr:hypothetical protein [Acidimicrobiia bacterium]